MIVNFEKQERRCIRILKTKLGISEKESLDTEENLYILVLKESMYLITSYKGNDTSVLLVGSIEPQDIIDALKDDLYERDDESMVDVRIGSKTQIVIHTSRKLEAV